MLSQLLARSGVGFLRLVDADEVNVVDLHRQMLYDEADAAARVPKVVAAARRLRRINSDIRIEPVVSRLEPGHAHARAARVGVIRDGTDN